MWVENSLPKFYLLNLKNMNLHKYQPTILISMLVVIKIAPEDT